MTFKVANHFITFKSKGLVWDPVFILVGGQWRALFKDVDDGWWFRTASGGGSVRKLDARCADQLEKIHEPELQLIINDQMIVFLRQQEEFQRRKEEAHQACRLFEQEVLEEGGDAHGGIQVVEPRQEASLQRLKILDQCPAPEEGGREWEGRSSLQGQVAEKPEPLENEQEEGQKRLSVSETISPPDSKFPPLPPELEQIDWVFLTRLGGGTYGDVSVGFNKSNGFTFAVKMLELKDGWGNKKQRRDRRGCIEQEIRLLSCLENEHIVKYYNWKNECIDGNETVCIFMELCPRGNLRAYRAYLKGLGLWPIKLVREYTRQILTGLAYIHGKGFAHGDIKMDNILVSASGQLKLADFGLSFLDGPDGEGDSGRERPENPYGTVSTMAPEMVRGKRSKLSDIWSLGCVVLELVGYPLWENYSNDTTILFALNQKKVPHQIQKISSSLLRDFLWKMLVADPRERSTAEELLREEWIICAESHLQEVEPNPSEGTW